MAMNLNQVNDTISPSTGGMSVAGIIANVLTISTSFSIPSGYSAMSTGPITIASGVTVTVPSGSKWVVL